MDFVGAGADGLAWGDSALWRVMLLAAILVSARLLRSSAAAASVSGRWRRLDGLKEGDFTPLGKGKGRSQLGSTTELARLRDRAGSVSSPLRELGVGVLGVRFRG